MDPKDMETAMDMFYEEMGWDPKTGAPTEGAYRKVGLAAVSDELKKKGGLP